MNITARYELPGFHSTNQANKIKEKYQGKSSMNFIIEFGGTAGNNSIIVMTERPETTDQELQEFFIAYVIGTM